MFEVDGFLQKTQLRMEKSVESLQMSFRKVRTGRAHPGILDDVMVVWHDAPTPLPHVCSINVEDAQTLSLSVWDKQLVPMVEKAIASAGLGLNPVAAGAVLRVPMPSLTEETRRDYVRQVRKIAEDSRVAVRNQRRDAAAELKTQTKAKTLSEDEGRRLQGRVQTMTDQHVARIDTLLKDKETQLMAV